MWERAARWSTQLRRECWVATGLSRWDRCSDPQGSWRGRESINPAKMKLCPGCHNPFASGGDLVVSEPLGVQLDYVGSWVIFGRISAAAPWEWRIMTHPTSNTSSAGSSGCSRGDRFGKHFKKCRNREGHMKASVLLQSELTSSGWA